MTVESIQKIETCHLDVPELCD